MGILPFRDSGFLDGVWRSPTENPSTNRNFRSCRFRIGLHRIMEGSEPAREDLRPKGLGASIVADIRSTEHFHRFKSLDGRRYGVELMRSCGRYVVVPACGRVRFVESDCVFCLPLTVLSLNQPVFSFPSLTAAPMIGPRQVSHAFRMMT